MKLEVFTEFDQKVPFEDYFDHVVTFARQTVLQEGAHATVLIVNEGARTAVYDVGSFFEQGDIGRKALNGALSDRYQGEANWFIQTAEAWLGRLKPHPTRPGEGLRPSENPDRIEVLMIAGVSRDGARREQMYEMVRDEAGSIVETKLVQDLSKFLSILEPPLFGGATTELEGARLVVEGEEDS